MLQYYRRLQPSLIYQPLLEGRYYPLLSFTSYHWKGATNRSLKASTLSTIADHVSSIFILDPPVSIWHTLPVTRFIYFLYTHTSSSWFRPSFTPEIHHYIHGCIVVSDLSVKNRARPYRYSLEKFLFTTLTMHTPFFIFSSPYIVFPLLKPWVKTTNR